MHVITASGDRWLRRLPRNAWVQRCAQEVTTLWRRKDGKMTDGLENQSSDPHAWQLQEIAHAAMELPLEHQSQRLREAIVRLAKADAEVYPTGASLNS
jgi:hypothetical protein